LVTVIQILSYAVLLAISNTPVSTSFPEEITILDVYHWLKVYNINILHPSAPPHHQVNSCVTGFQRQNSLFPKMRSYLTLNSIFTTHKRHCQDQSSPKGRQLMQKFTGAVKAVVVHITNLSQSQKNA
jgi:hypothetical protein